jgi:hypothetical protein
LQLTYARQGLARYKQRLQRKVVHEWAAVLWDIRARVGEAIWARRKTHRAARLLGRRKLLGACVDTWRAEVERNQSARAFRKEKGGL